MAYRRERDQIFLEHYREHCDLHVRCDLYHRDWRGHRVLIFCHRGRCMAYRRDWHDQIFLACFHELHVGFAHLRENDYDRQFFRLPQVCHVAFPS